MRVGVILALVLSACGGGPSAPVKLKNPDAPNVLLVSIDTLRRDHLPSYGYHRDTAPTLTQIAAEGAQADNAYSMAPATDGSHATLFTGRYMSEHGKFSHMQRLGGSELTLAEHFRNNGYRTFGLASSVKFIKKSGFGQGFDRFANRSSLPKNKRSRWVMRQLMLEIDKLDEPWFGFVHLFDPHAPYAPPKRWRTLWHPPSRLVQARKTTRFLRRYRRRPKKVSPAQMNMLKALYDGGITFADYFMLVLHAAVKAGPARPTLMVVTSDHGEAFHEHGYLGHDRHVYEEIMQVPLLFWWPGTIPAGSHLDRPIQGADVFPTIAELAGLPIPENVSGRSHAAALRGEPSTPDPEGLVLMQSTKRWGIALNTPTGRFKFTRHVKEGIERLVHLDDDPMGLVNVIKDHPLVRKHMYNRLASFKMVDAHGRGLQREDIDEEELAALKAIGYID
jgi:choline-sulfatase